MRYPAENREASAIEGPQSHLRPRAFPRSVGGLDRFPSLLQGTFEVIVRE